MQEGKAAGRGPCLLCALAFVLVLFGDVIFLGASLAPIDYLNVLANPNQTVRTVSLFPERPGRTIYHGQGDIGAALFQMEPAQKFIAFCMRHGESPYWDPYTATGALGPETLVDLKFAPLTVLTALLGASSTALSFVLVGLYFLSAYCLLRIVTVHLGRSLAGAFAACALFFLNGFALGNLYTQIGQPYFLAPLLLLALLIATARPSPASIALALGANVLFLATTFFPIAVLLAIVAYGFTLCVRIAETPNRWRSILGLLIALPLGALALLSFLYVPVFAAYLTYLDTVQQYATRLTPGISLLNLISLFTPKHIWESYRALRMPTDVPVGNYNQWVQHIGIAGPMIAIHAFAASRRTTFWPVCCLGAFILTAFGQIFGIFPFTLLDSLPFFNFVRNEYWSGMLVFALVLLLGYGFDAVRNSNSFSYASIALIAVIVCAFLVMYRHVRREQPRISMVPNTVNSGLTVDIDIPGPKDGSFTGPSLFGGWAISNKSPVRRVSIAVDGRSYGYALYGPPRGMQRPDVCAIYRQAVGCPFVGWVFRLDTTRFSNGPHTLEVTAYADGQATEMRQFTVSNPWIPSYLRVFWLIVAAICLTLVLAKKPQFTQGAKIAALVILVAEGIFYMNNLRPIRSERDVHLAPVISWLKTRISADPSSRILNIGSSGVFPDWGSALQIPQLGDANSGDLPWYRHFYQRYIGHGLFLSVGLEPGDTFLFTDTALSLAGVRYVLVDRSITAAMDRVSSFGYPVAAQDPIRVVFQNPHPMPRSFIVHQWLKSDELPSNSGQLGAAVSTTDSKLITDFKRLGVMAGPNGVIEAGGPEKVEVVQYRHDFVQLRCDTQTAGALLLTDSWQPQWTATLDGKAVYIGRGDVAFRVIAMPAGKHEVIFRYRPLSQVAGEIASVAATLCILTWLVTWSLRTKRT